MPDNTSLLRPNDLAWDAFLQRVPHDCYYLAAYHAFAERMGEGRAMMFVAESGDRLLLWPYLLRHLEGSLTDATSVYGYTGPSGAGLDDAAFRAESWSTIRDAWRAQGVVSVFTRFHPLIANAGIVVDMHGDAQPPGGETCRVGPSVSIDLGLDLEARRMAYPQNLRQEIKKSERQGLEVHLDRGWTDFSSFVEFYRETMSRNDASDRYFFSEEYLLSLRDALGDIAHLTVARVDGEPAAALLFTVYRDIAEAHLTGVNKDFARYSPLKGLIDRTCEIARGLGAKVLHLGAGRGGAEDSLFAFKARFSSRRHDFVLGRWIVDAESYERLKRERGVEDDGAFFPVYRKPPAAVPGR